MFTPSANEVMKKQEREPWRVLSLCEVNAGLFGASSKETFLQ